MNNLRIKFEEINVTCAKSTGSCFINNKRERTCFWYLTRMSDSRAASAQLLVEFAGSRSLGLVDGRQPHTAECRYPMSQATSLC